MENMLKTGEVAEMLGVSRQHVVDMCERGELSYVRVGTHRRVPKREVEKLLPHRLTREQEKSLWLHRALLTQLMVDPERVMTKARENLGRWSGLHRSDGMTVGYFDQWKRVLDDGVDAVVEAVISPAPEACEMRQNSPFAEVLPNETRVRVLRSFKDHWNQEHEPAMAR